MSQGSSTEIPFGPFKLDLPNARLLRAGKPVALTPKAFDALAYLARHPHKLITKEELLSKVWADVIVSDASVKVCVAELRKALDDDPKAPRYIQTAHRRGYRFIGIGPADEQPIPETESRPAPRVSLPFVGRARELAAMESAHAESAGGQRQIVLLSGAAGTGKTTLVQAFVRSLEQRQHGQDHAITCVGHCFKQFGASEPYLPLWEALSSIPRDAREASLQQTLLARTSSQRPADASIGTLPSSRNTSDRLVRELIEAIEAQARVGPLVIVIEDLHWADYSTLDLISALARRQTATRLMIVATLRPSDAGGAEALRTLAYDLLSRRLCSEIRLGYLEADSVAQYLKARFPLCAPGELLCHMLYQRTLGHPLFLVSLIDDLLEQGMLRDGAASIGTTQLAKVIEERVPDTARAMIESQFDRLDETHRRVLEAAAVGGIECSGAGVAGALEERSVVRCEEVCDDLARHHRFLEPHGVVEWPDGTIANQYRFAHELYHNVVYSRLPAARCAQMHRALGLRLESAWGARANDVAAGLAVHFERGREWARAVNYLRSAADHATRLYAHREAADYLHRALEMLRRLPYSDRPVDELTLLMNLGVHLQVTKGFAAPEVRQVHDRAYALCRQAEDTRRVYPVLWGIWLYKKVRSDLREARTLAMSLLSMAQDLKEPAYILQAHQSMAVTSMCLGEPEETARQMELARTLYDPRAHGANTQRFGQDPCVSCLAFGAIALWLMNEPERSLKASEESLELARQLAQPSSMALALHFSSMLQQLRGDAGAAERQARRVIELAAWEDFSFWHAGGRILAGWARASQEDTPRPDRDDAIKEMRRGIEAWLATGSRTYHSYFTGLLGDALLKQGRSDEAVEALEEAIRLSGELHEGLYEAQLHRLMAAALLKSDRASLPRAREALNVSIAIAHRQRAHFFERLAIADRDALAGGKRSLRPGKSR